MGTALILAALIALPSTASAAEHALTFEHAGARLSGVLRLPEGRGPYPAVVLVHGSGPITARQMMGGSGDRLVAAGFAVFAYDKRGVGESAGEYTTVGVGNSERMFDLLAGDAIAAVQTLRARKDIDKRRVGLFGISQGGWIAPLAASRSSAIRFVAILAGPAVSVGEEIFYSRLAGEDPGSLQGMDDKEIERRMRAFKGPHGYDPAAALKTMSVPSLWVLGERDRSIPLASTVANLERLRTAGRPVTVHLVPGVNHSMRNPTTGERPDFWQPIIAWLRER